MDGRLDEEAAGRILRGYDAVRQLSPELADAVRSEVEHAALIIAFHRPEGGQIRDKLKEITTTCLYLAA